MVSPPFLRLGARQPGATLERRMPRERPPTQSVHTAIMGSKSLVRTLSAAVGPTTFHRPVADAQFTHFFGHADDHRIPRFGPEVGAPGGKPSDDPAAWPMRRHRESGHSCSTRPTRSRQRNGRRVNGRVRRALHLAKALVRGLPRTSHPRPAPHRMASIFLTACQRLAPQRSPSSPVPMPRRRALLFWYGHDGVGLPGSSGRSKTKAISRPKVLQTCSLQHRLSL